MKIKISPNCFKIDKPNFTALTKGFVKNGTRIHQAIWCDVKKKQYPALFTVQKSKARHDYPLSKIGDEFNDGIRPKEYKYIAELVEEYFITNKIELWEKLCNNGLFDIWEPQALFNRFKNTKADASQYRIALLRVYEIEEVFVQNDIISTSFLDRINDLNKLIVTAKKPVIDDNTFSKIKELLENSIAEFNNLNKQGKQNTEKINKPQNNSNLNADYPSPIIKEIELTNFLNFSDQQIKFAQGINLFIGENNIGKTGLLKFLYANLKAYEEYIKQKGTILERSFKEIISIKIQKTFQSDDKIGTIVGKSSDNELKSKIIFGAETNENIELNFKKTTQTEIPNTKYTEYSDREVFTNYNVVFIPAKEILSISSLIKVGIKTYNTEGFDATYEDLLSDIEPLFMQRLDNDIFNKISIDIEKNIISGQIEYDKNKSKYFYKDSSNNKFDLTMSAEGVKQLGIIPLLIKTGKITKGTILFLDEPDNNLNPVAIRKFVTVLFDLIKAGVQIFITTHNHLFSQYISLFSEFKNIDIPECKFFALFKDEKGKTNIECGADLLDIQNNLILDEYVKLGDTEQELISKSQNK